MNNWTLGCAEEGKNTTSVNLNLSDINGQMI